MTRMMLALASVLALAGCGNNRGLEVAGHVGVVTALGTPTGFNFPESVRLDGGPGYITGTCTLAQTTPGAYGVVIDLFSSNMNAEGRAIRSMTIMTSSTSVTGRIEAQLGQDDFENGSCQIRVNSLDPQAGYVQLETLSDCEIVGPGGEIATVELELGLTRCTVE